MAKVPQNIHCIIISALPLIKKPTHFNILSHQYHSIQFSNLVANVQMQAFSTSALAIVNMTVCIILPVCLCV